MGRNSATTFDMLTSWHNAGEIGRLAILSDMSCSLLAAHCSLLVLLDITDASLLITFINRVHAIFPFVSLSTLHNIPYSKAF